MMVLNVLLFCSGCLSPVWGVKIGALDVHVANERLLLGTPNKWGSKGIINPRPSRKYLYKLLVGCLGGASLLM